MFTQFFLLFGLIAIGYIARSRGWINSESLDSLGDLLIYLIIPPMLLSSILSLEIEQEILSEFIWMSLYSLGFFVVYFLLAKLYIRLFKVPFDYKETMEVSFVIPNNGFMGFPIALAFFGYKGLLFMVANNMVMNITLFTYGVYLIKRSNGINIKESISGAMKQILNPSIIAIAIGLLLGVSGLQNYLPVPVEKLITILGELATPLSMMYIGATLFGSSLKELIRDKMIVKATIARALLLPIATLILLNIFHIAELMGKILFVVSVFPCAAVVPILVAEYGKHVETSVRMVLFSTILSLLTMPIGVYLTSILW
ncbi:MAG: AEC family transporter [Clostridiales bacterium]|nr:AEC family transporter [Clostridiales bacterium]